jgi:hypothetical protein
MECEFNRTPYKRTLDNYSGHEHLTASMQPRKYLEDTFKMLDATKEVLGRHLQDGVQENSKTPSEVLGRLQNSSTKSSGACQTRAHETVHIAYIS